jgi:hypothetical protein
MVGKRWHATIGAGCDYRHCSLAVPVFHVQAADVSIHAFGSLGLQLFDVFSALFLPQYNTAYMQQ